MLRYILLLSLTYVIVISVSPGDEHEECAVPDYNENVNVLLDSWRYNALLDEPSAVWATDTDDNNNSKRWHGLEGNCSSGEVEVCISRRRRKSWLFTQYIKQTVSVDYTVRVFIEISYEISECSHDCREFTVIKYITNSEDSQGRLDPDNYEENDIEPESRIPSTDDNEQSMTTGNAVIYFDLERTETGFYLGIESDEMMCLTISRILVYTQACPTADVDLVQYLLTLGPSSGSVTVMGQCVDNAEMTQPGTLRCNSRGEWSGGDQIMCQCNEGYYEEENRCRRMEIAYITPVMSPYRVTEEQTNAHVCFVLNNSLPSTLELSVSTIDGTALGNIDYVSIEMNIEHSEDGAGTTECVEIEIVDDDFKEADESFTVVVENGNLVLTQVLVIIESSDSDNECNIGSVRVVSDVNNSSLQLVEMCTSEGVWSPVCDTSWTIQDATVVCRELALRPSLSPRIENIPSDSKIALLVFECEGTESGLIMCPMSLYFNTVCYYALVQCNTPNTSSYISGLEKSSSVSLPSLPIAIETSSILEYQTKLIITSDIKSEYHIMSSSSISLHLPPSIDGNQQETSNDSTRAGKVIAGVAVALLVVIVIVVGILLLCVIIIYRKQTMYNVKENNNGNELQNPLYDDSKRIVVQLSSNDRPPDVPVQDPIYVEADIERAVQNGPTYVEANSVVVKPSLTPSTSDIFDDPVYAGSTVTADLTVENSSERGVNLPVIVNANERGASPVYDVIHNTNSTTADSTGQSLQSPTQSKHDSENVNCIPVIQAEDEQRNEEDIDSDESELAQ